MLVHHPPNFLIYIQSSWQNPLALRLAVFVPHIPSNLIQGINGVLRVNSAIETFYHDAPPAVQTHAAELIGTQSMMTMLTPSAQPAWATNEYDGRLVYIKCMDDRVLSPEVQEMMLVICGAKDKVRIVEIMSSHSPWLSVPDTFEGILDGLAKEWV